MTIKNEDFSEGRLAAEDVEIEILGPEDENQTDMVENFSTEDYLALKSQVGQLEKQNQELLAASQRTQADFDNFRRRTRQEKEDLSKYAAEQLLGAMLPVLDNFERALTANRNAKDINAVITGVEMIFRQFSDTLQREGLSPIECLGQEFDPNLHNAVMQVETDEQPDNSIVEVLQKGYQLHGKVIRPAMVKVARGC